MRQVSGVMMNQGITDEADDHPKFGIRQNRNGHRDTENTEEDKVLKFFNADHADATELLCYSGYFSVFSVFSVSRCLGGSVANSALA